MTTFLRAFIVGFLVGLVSLLTAGLLDALFVHY